MANGETQGPDGERIAVVLVNFNGGDLTFSCLRHLGESSLTPAITIIIDNASTDGSADSLRSIRSNDLEVICNSENLGFAKACNQGIRRALELPVDFVFLLNNDARLAPDALKYLVHAAVEQPKAGLLGGKIFLDDGPKLWCAGVDVGFFPNLQDLRGFGKEDVGQFDREEKVGALTGCGLLLRRAFLEAGGLFDEDFFVYVEDLELSIRGKKMGWDCLYVPKAELFHAAGSTSGRGYGPWRKYMVAYNLILFLKKQGNWALWGAFLLLDVLCWPLVLVAGILRGRTKGVLAKGLGLIHGLFGFQPRPPRSSSE